MHILAKHNSVIAYAQLLLLLFFNNFGICTLEKAHPTILQTSKGWIEGKLDGTTRLFLGIPYAKAPHGDLRFAVLVNSIMQRPVAMDPWRKDRFLTKKFGPTCPQEGSDNISEDCLFINVFTPKDASMGTLPVVVYVFGGGFKRASGDVDVRAVKNNFVSKGVIFVSFNYRSNAFGFFTTRSEDVPGNLGLYDALMALQWVQTEISRFGGDASKVTLAGHSAGAAMASVLTYSPMAQGLFRSVILSSGSASNSWTVDGTYGGRELTGRCTPSNREFAMLSGCISKRDWNQCDFHNFTQCLRRKSLSQLMEYVKKTPGSFRLVLDPPDGFIPKLVEDMKHVPGLKYMVGANSDERADDYGKYNNKQLLDAANTEHHLRKSIQLGINVDGFGVLYEHVYNMTKQLYTPKSMDAPWPWVQAAVEVSLPALGFWFRSDYWMTAGIAKEVRKIVTDQSPVYLYSLDHRNPTLSPHPTIKAVGHPLFLDYLFHVPQTKPRSRDSKKIALDRISEFVRTTVINFIKTGDPNKPVALPVYWPPVHPTSGNLNYLSIDTPASMQPQFHRKADQLFNEFVPNLVETMNLVASPTCQKGNSTSLADFGFTHQQEKAESDHNQLIKMLLLFLIIFVVLCLALDHFKFGICTVFGYNVNHKLYHFYV